MRALLTLCALLPLSGAAAPLEDWPCNWLADYYALVAVDRDAGMSSSERIDKTERLALSLELSADDKLALIAIVQDVYTWRDTPKNIRRDALSACLRGRAPAPRAAPSLLKVTR